RLPLRCCSKAVSKNWVFGDWVAMRCNRAFHLAAGAALLFILSGFSFGQSSAGMRITAPVNDSDVALLPGGVHPRISHAVDQGSVSASMPLQRMAIFFKPSTAQQQDLQNLLAEQQDPRSPNYHKWLTPEQYGARFGMSAGDVAKVTQWLQARGFQNISASRGL